MPTPSVANAAGFTASDVARFKTVVSASDGSVGGGNGVVGGTPFGSWIGEVMQAV